MSVRWAILFVLAGCGRIGFEASDASADAHSAACFEDRYDLGLSSWDLRSGTWGEAGGVFAQTDLLEHRAMATVADSSWSDLDLRVDVRLVSDCPTCGDIERLVFRWVDDDNWAAVFFSRYYRVLGVEQWIGGQRALVEIDRPHEVGRWYQLRARVEGAAVELYIDDALLVPWILPDPDSRGAVGLSTDPAEVHFDNFLVTSCAS